MDGVDYTLEKQYPFTGGFACGAQKTREETESGRIIPSDS